MSTEHTPTPWDIEPHAHASEYADIYGADSDSPLACDATLADAAHIVRCVNAHDALVEACKPVIEWGDKYNPEEDPTVVIELTRDEYNALTAALEAAGE